MYLKFLWNLITKHINDYKAFVYRQDIKKFIDKRRREQRVYEFNHCPIENGKTLREIHKENQEFEKNNPELFPGLAETNALRAEKWELYLDTFKIRIQ